ncbi:MAG: excinuclease ABC subunit UvrA [Phycisphaerae bacterium]|nr:excinuclease ABC subunit UvrA [Phycisphaerae bacterium]NIS50194.1 excinuclease ABC subunit UvrA [Phycisphaerae bacterium]NIU11445.1 excinuclease ABC subunit UvrA [Phycisphaerae bacterium]NIU56494.1 excinuclease ABC subunit UvrA [Phycisphaerae bacterium]NIV01840.1 excinuclease ABC subunit UvrA [Phycisphaerae bacterium]
MARTVEKAIKITGAAEHNLKNINVSIPRDKLVVITGISGSGKSSLAFDTIYAEGRRKYVESLSAYARQFLEQMQKPAVGDITGLPPTIAIEQRRAGSNPRSTVATTTEIYDYFRLLFARVGQPHCWVCGKEITSQHSSQIVDSILSRPEATKIQVCAPLVRGKKGEHKEVFAGIQREGFVRVRVDKAVYDVRNVPALNKNKKHDIAAVVDRLILKEGVRIRLADSVETALKLAEGILLVLVQEPEKGGEKSKTGKPNSWKEIIYSEKFACSKHPQASLEELSPRLFSFNSPYGACKSCDGLGTILEFDPDLIVPDKSVSLDNGAVDAWRKGGKRMNIFYNRLIKRFCRNVGIRKSIAFEKIPAEIKRILMYGTTPADRKKYGFSFEGVIPNLNRRWENTTSEYVKTRLHGYLSEQPCQSCNGARLRPEAAAVTVGGKNINQLTELSIEKAQKFFKKLELDKEKALIATQVLKEIKARLKFMVDVGLEYLTLDRKSSTLSGGEAQRIRLATQVGSGLVGVCYVLDEPTIGLHKRDNNRLMGILQRLSQIGNTVIVVEHDEDIIKSADHIIDIGPAAGAQGGEVVVQGSFKKVAGCGESATGEYLSGKKQIALPAKRRKYSLRRCIEVKEAAENNLKNIDVKFPLGVFCCVTGVSGSGKSSLVSQILLPACKRRLYNSREKPGKHKNILGTSQIDKVIEINQSPIGKTPRSNPATYTGVFDEIRKLFSLTREAKIRGYKPGRFSFNVKGGRCEACRGQGTKKIEMHFLPDVYVTCQACRGKRYNPETMQVTYKGKNIADVLDMRVKEALDFFANFPTIVRVLRTLNDVGLGYMQLGQSSTTLSGGEAQRVKLSSELGKAATGHTLYLLDEPTTGLHFADIHNLLDVLARLCDMGNTVVVIEHNLDVIKMADHIIDLGPQGGDAGGKVVAAGKPEEIIKNRKSYTAKFLKEKL